MGLPVTDLAVYERKIERERRARFEAERLLDEKSRELYAVNNELWALADANRYQADLTAAILASAAEGILTFSESYQITSANSAAEEIFGCKNCSLVGAQLASLFNESAFAEHIDQLIPREGKGGHAIEIAARRVDGESVPIEWSTSRLDFHESIVFTAVVRDLTHRKMLESQLAHAQKMESVGQLAAGIAHEINTPMQYVSDNVHFATDAVKDIWTLIDAYQRLDEAINVKSTEVENILGEIRGIKSAIDLDFLVGELPSALCQTKDGIDRVTHIVKSMKEFSHPGNKEKSPTEINHIVQSTLTVSKHEWKYVANVETHLDENLPPIKLIPGEINQVLLNLVVNAAQAIGEKQTRSGDRSLGLIQVSTQLCRDHVEIRIKDSGTGIPASIRNRIFDPFFTTKPVGVGTGQGLALTYQVIVNHHGGLISVDSEEGQGTTFKICLPLANQALSRESNHETSHSISG